MVRVRFAPSPTGYLHIGGARTALFNWLFARQNKGAFILRIEDTDVERSTREAIDAIIQGMTWLGLTWDEGPFFQSKNFDLYRVQAQNLLNEGKTYRCWCTPEELEEKRKKAMKEGRKPKYDGTCRSRTAPFPEGPFALRFKAPQSGLTEVDDVIRGKITFDNAELDDLIILRSDGTPTYNFCVVVDDVSMNITHVIRGDDHLNNTPRQVLLYNAFGFTLPRFAHVPMILGHDKTRLSKRHGATSVLAYKEMGYLPEALVNYLVRLGWSSGDQEVFTIQELIDKFDLSTVGKSPGVFNPEKLLWLNAYYIRHKTGDELFALAAPFLEKFGHHPVKDEGCAKLLRLVAERSRTLEEMARMSEFYLQEELSYDPKDVKKIVTRNTPALLSDMRDTLTGLPAFSQKDLEAVFKKFTDERGIPLKDIAQPVRLAVTGRTVSPGLFEVLEILGKDKVLTRLDRFLQESTRIDPRREEH